MGGGWRRKGKARVKGEGRGSAIGLVNKENNSVRRHCWGTIGEHRLDWKALYLQTITQIHKRCPNWPSTRFDGFRAERERGAKEKEMPRVCDC